MAPTLVLRPQIRSLRRYRITIRGRALLARRARRIRKRPVKLRFCADQGRTLYEGLRPSYLPLFTGVRGRGILRSSQARSSRKFGKTPARRTYKRTWLRSASFGYYRGLFGFLMLPHNTYWTWPAARLLAVRSGAICKKEKTITPSRFIGNSSARAFLRARKRIRVRCEKGKPVVRRVRKVLGPPS
jgi:hypothetical protein